MFIVLIIIASKYSNNQQIEDNLTNLNQNTENFLVKKKYNIIRRYKKNIELTWLNEKKNENIT